MAHGNANITVYGASTQFGKDGGPDASAAARKKNTEQHAQNIRLALRRLAVADFDVSKPLTLDELVKKFGRDGTEISGAQMLAARKFLLALKGDARLLKQITDDIDGKQVQALVQAKTTLADLVNASVSLERQEAQTKQSEAGHSPTVKES